VRRNRDKLSLQLVQLLELPSHGREAPREAAELVFTSGAEDEGVIEVAARHGTHPLLQIAYRTADGAGDGHGDAGCYYGCQCEGQESGLAGVTSPFSALYNRQARAACNLTLRACNRHFGPAERRYHEVQRDGVGRLGVVGTRGRYLRRGFPKDYRHGALNRCGGLTDLQLP